MLLDTKYSRKSFTKLSSKEIGKLGTTARDLFHFISEFWKLYNDHNEISVYFHNSKIQRIDTDTCGVFQLYFYERFHSPSHESDIKSNEKLFKSTVYKFLNEKFSLDKEVNQKKLKL